ncbi:MAG TPA: DUF885 family protein, partial [Burkholderiaceae bacterium]
MRVIPTLLLSLFLSAACVCAAHAAAPASVAALGATPARQAAKLYDYDWQWRMRHNPELATSVGDNRYNDRLSDMSLAASLEANAHNAAMLKLARGIAAGKLSGQDALSHKLFVYEKEMAVKAAAFYPYVVQPITQQDGVHINFVQLVAQTPFKTTRDYRNYLARLRALPRYIDGVIAQLEHGMQSGWVAPSANLRIVPDQIAQLGAKLMESPLATPFKEIPLAVPAQERTRLAQAGTQALQRDVAPALRKLEQFIRTRYAPAT